MSKRTLPIKMDNLTDSYYGSGTIYYIDDPKLFCIEPLRQGRTETVPINKWSRGIDDKKEMSFVDMPYTVSVEYFYYRGFPVYNPEGPAINLKDLTVYTNSQGQIHNLTGAAYFHLDYDGKRVEEYFIDGRQYCPATFLYYLISTKEKHVKQFLFSDNELLRKIAKEAINGN